MAKNRIEKLRARRTDPYDIRKVAFDEAIAKIKEDDPIKYVVETMTPIEKDYTDATFAEGDRIKNQLDKSLNYSAQNAEFDYQGSVTNDTHVKLYSDLDLLVIDTDFESIEPPAKAEFPYQGNPLAELKKLRADCTAILKKEFPAATVDADGAKCISIRGGSLRRKIDVVIANWWNTVAYQRHSMKMFRGVKVLDTSVPTRHENKPFYHNFKVDQRDQECRGNLRKVCRYLKSEKYDADSDVDISSYDIVSIAWNMPDSYLTPDKGMELALTQNARQYLGSLITNESARNALSVPNGMRKVFGEGGATLAGLASLYLEVSATLKEVEASLTKTYRKIQDARVNY